LSLRFKTLRSLRLCDESYITAALVTIAAWAVTVRGADSMSGGMPMPGGWSMSMMWMMGGPSWFGRAAMFLGMWQTMMVAMMLPSVMPVVLLHRRVMENRARPMLAELLLLSGYFGVWLAFGAVAYAAGTTLSSSAMQSQAVSRMIPTATALALILAGWYQVTRWKRLCLSHCRSPIGVLVHHPLRTAADSLRVGIHHGAYCAACCWGLMLIQLVLGIMSLPLMAAVAFVILLEKTWRHGESLAAAVGISAMTAGVLLAISAIRSFY